MPGPVEPRKVLQMHNTAGSNINVLKRISKETAKAIGTGKQLFSHDTAWVSGMLNKVTMTSVDLQYQVVDCADCSRARIGPGLPRNPPSRIESKWGYPWPASTHRPLFPSA
jgi:hypothetical protein